MRLNNFWGAVTLLALAGCQARSSGPDRQANPDMTEFATEVDTNGDGKMSRSEWEAKGLPPSSFAGFEKGRGFVTLEDYRSHPAPPGIDLNGDGKLTVAEFKEFDRTRSAKGAPTAPAHRS